MIVFGHNNFLIKSFTPEDLGIPEANPSRIKLEVRQKYAHIFWIPFFPIGKLYCIKKPNDSDLYNAPEDLIQIIKAYNGGGYPTKWYSFAGPLFLIAAFIFYSINEKVEEYNYEKNSFIEVHDHKGMIQYPTSGDYYEMEYKNIDNSSTTSVVYKVNNYTDTHVSLISLHENILAEVSSYREEKYTKMFDTTSSKQLNLMSIPKEKLISLVDSSFWRSGYSFEPQEIKETNTGVLFRIKKIYRRDKF